MKRITALVIVGLPALVAAAEQLQVAPYGANAARHSLQLTAPVGTPCGENLVHQTTRTKYYLVEVQTSEGTATLPFECKPVAVPDPDPAPPPAPEPPPPPAQGWHDGASVTITGRGFGVKSPAAPLVWAPLTETLQPAPVSRVPEWSAGMRAGIATAPDGAPAARWNIGRDTGWPAAEDANGFRITLASAPAVLYLRGEKWVDFDPVPTPLKNHKTWRAVSADHASPWLNWYASWGHNASGDGRVSVEGAGGGGWNDTRYPIRRWNVEEWHYRNSAPGEANGVLRFTQNGRAMHLKESGAVSYDPEAVVTSLPSNPGIVTFGAYDDASNVPLQTPAPEWPIYYRNLYYDDTFARVEVCARESGGHCEIQIPTAWGDAAITVQARQGRLAGFVGAYVRVYDAQNRLALSARIE